MPMADFIILFVCGLLLGENNLSSLCHENSKPANFSLPVGSPGKNVQISFSLWSAVYHRSFLLICGMPPLYTVGGNGWNFYLYRVGERLKNRCFFRDDQKIVKYGSGSYWRPKESHHMLIWHIFSCYCLFSDCRLKAIIFNSIVLSM
jgi:hypothetical protein